MIKFENTQVVGWEPAIRGMRNPKNSWEKSDSEPGCEIVTGSHKFCRECDHAIDIHGNICCDYGYKPDFVIGPNDHDLMMSLAKAGSVHAKYRRMIVVYVDITAPLYWWKEFDTYKVGTVANSCSTMHKLAERDLTIDDFSEEHLDNIDIGGHIHTSPRQMLKNTISMINECRKLYKQTGDKYYWEQMIQLLPSSYNQKRTIMFNYEVLANIYQYRRNHKLDEWAVGFIDWIKSLPYSELITCTVEKEEEKTEKDAFTVCLDALSLIDQLTDAQQEMMIHNLCSRINKARGMET